jgi:hypothetical protein
LNWQPSATLTVARRRKRNDLANFVVEKISEVVKKSGTNVIFVDYCTIAILVTLVGRYCAPEIREPQPDNYKLAFFELNAEGFLGTSLVSRDQLVGDGVGNSFYARLNKMATLAEAFGVNYTDEQISKRAGPDLLADPTIKDSFKRTYCEVQTRNLFIPDGYGRIFHPSRSGHRLIAGKVVWHMQQYNAAKNDAGVWPGTVDANTGPSTCKIADALTPTLSKIIEVTLPKPVQSMTSTGTDNKR